MSTILWTFVCSIVLLSDLTRRDREEGNDNNISIYIQHDATLHSLFYLETTLQVSGGTCTHHQERKQLYLQHLVFVQPSLLPAAIAEVVATV